MAYLIFCPNSPHEKVYLLHKEIKNTIGRNPDNSICFVDSSLSRHHAEIEWEGNTMILTDCNSTNGTFVNGVKITKCDLQDGDEIRFGSVDFKFVQNLNIQRRPAASPKITEMVNRGKIDGSIINLPEQNTQQRTADKLHIFLEVSKQLSSPKATDNLLEKILDLLFEILTIDRAAILLRDEQTGQLQCQAVKAQPGITTGSHFYSQSIANLACQQKEAILTTDAQTDFPGVDSVLQQGIHASVCVPLYPREEVIGVLYIDNLSLSNIYVNEDVEFLTALASQAAIAIDNARLYEKMESEAVLRSKLERFFPQSVSRKLKEEGNLEIIDTEVTALFADISGFTYMSSTMEPRQVISMLNDYFNVIVEEIVFAYEGTLEKYIGDALFAIWGAPYTREDDTERAIKAAIEMQWAVQRLNERWESEGKEPISIHIGLNSGQVAAGNIGSRNLIQYATIGDTTNVTSRICNKAQADEIMVSESTFQKLTSMRLPFEKMPLVTVKGKNEPLQLYRLHWRNVAIETLAST